MSYNQTILGVCAVGVISPKERLSLTLQKAKVDRPPVICSGGMMNAAVVEVMNTTGHTLPEAHHDDRLMAALAYQVYEKTGFENLGLPFCMTVEAEVMGSEVDFGSLACEPKIAREVFPSVSQVVYSDIREMLNSGRVHTILQAGYQLSRKYPDVPLIGSITGPVSTAASIVDPITFLKELRRDRENTHKVMEYVSDFLIEYARLLADNGADAICIGDPTATGEILGPKMFEEYALTYLNKVIEAIQELNVPVIVHICGNLQSVKTLIPRIKGAAFSTDAMVNLKGLKAEFPQLTTMGNISTYLLEFGTPEQVYQQAGRLIRDGIDIISPACGLSTSTSLKNITALTKAVKEC